MTQIVVSQSFNSQVARVTLADVLVSGVSVASTVGRGYSPQTQEQAQESAKDPRQIYLPDRGSAMGMFFSTPYKISGRLFWRDAEVPGGNKRCRFTSR